MLLLVAEILRESVDLEREVLGVTVAEVTVELLAREFREAERKKLLLLEALLAVLED